MVRKMIEILSGLVAFLVLMFGIEKYKNAVDKKVAAEKEVAREAEVQRVKDKATAALVRGVTNEQASTDPRTHDFK